MKVKDKIECPYCAAQRIQMDAVVQKEKAIKPDQTRYGCENKHFFAVPTADVLRHK